jgi:hypothetical protein
VYKTWPEDIRKKLSLHDLRRMNGWTPPTVAVTELPELRDKIGDLLGIGALARNDSTILTSLRNIKKFAEMLHAIERNFFMVPGEVDEDFPDDEPEDECVLNCWGSTIEEYVEQFRAAQAARSQVVTVEMAQRAFDAYWAEPHVDPYNRIRRALEAALFGKDVT